MPTCLETSSKRDDLLEDDVVQANNQKNNNAGKGSTKKPRFTLDAPLDGDDIMATLCETGTGFGNAGCVGGVLREIRPSLDADVRNAMLKSRDEAVAQPKSLDPRDFACRETGEAPYAVWRAC